MQTLGEIFEQEESNAQLRVQISDLQEIQKRNPLGSFASRLASKQLAPLFAEMARRQKAGLL
jgi:phage antirepressor YoqD-like protein